MIVSFVVTATQQRELTFVLSFISSLVVQDATPVGLFFFVPVTRYANYNVDDLSLAIVVTRYYL